MTNQRYIIYQWPQYNTINTSLVMIKTSRMMAKMAALSILLAGVWLPVAVAQTTTQPTSFTNNTTLSPSPPPSINNNTTSPTISPIILPTASPTESPIVSPTRSPTISPSTEPSPSPSISRPPTSSPSTSWIPTVTPTISAIPTYSPSSSPSSSPTVSPAPTSKPSISSQPSSQPTSGTPTSAPNPLPTASPLVAPSAAPSLNSTDTITKKFSQWLIVNNGKEFDDVEIDIYEKAVMEQYTVNFGDMVGEPFVTTVCTVIQQALAGRRKRFHFGSSVIGDDEEPIRRLGSRENNDISNHDQQQQQQKQQQKHRHLQTESELTLVVTFTMTYTSRYGVDVSNYPVDFKNYVNGNLQAVTLDMQNKFLPVTTAKDVILFLDVPTMEPTVKDPTMSPTESNVLLPTQLPSVSPTLPISPPTPTKQPTADGGDTDRMSFIVGLAAGLGGATLIVVLLIWYMRRRNARIRVERNFGDGENDESFEIISADSPEAKAMGGSGNTYVRNVTDSEGVNRSVVVVRGRGATDSVLSKDTILSNPSMVSGGGSGSFSSDSDQDNGLKSLQEEFDMHKSQNMELMTGGASLAMTRALMEDEDNMDKNQWGNGKRGRGGMDDAEFIEANALCETHDWLRKNEKSSLEERNAFFQQILNKMVYTVRQGLNPSDGTSIIHSCAAMLGLQLENDLPNNVLLVTGLLKTKDTTQGRQYLIEAFEPFGDIESAAIASSNKGFGFVRFVHPRSVQRALERFRTSEIEVQDVSVMIRALKV